MIYFIGLMGMKTCVFFIFQLCPWIIVVGNWALKWTEGNTAIQIAFVMLIFPLIMNAMQYYIIDSFIKNNKPNAEEQDRDGRGDGEEEDNDQRSLLHPEDDDDENAREERVQEAENGDGRKNPNIKISLIDPEAEKLRAALAVVDGELVSSTQGSSSGGSNSSTASAMEGHGGRH